VKQSAGLLLYRPKYGLQVLLGHPGGPYYEGKDDGVWTIPKGEFEPPEEPLDAAIREFNEEIGVNIEVDWDYIELTPIKTKTKIIHIFALQGDTNLLNVKSNKFIMEWPKGSGNMQEYLEIDSVGWFNIRMAKVKIHKNQLGFLDELERLL
jgi:predicted NUDIX family NTP pyrophosphohydrolase